jgi:hypothetical protein
MVAKDGRTHLLAAMRPFAKPFIPVTAAAVVALLVGALDARSRPVLVAAGPGPVTAAKPLRLESVGSGAARATLDGLVRAADGAAVAGALVAVSRAGDLARAAGPATLEIVARSDAAGRFHIAAVAAGHHHLTASAPGLSAAHAEVEVGAADPPPIELRLGGGRAGASGTPLLLTGQVHGAGARPLAAALVRAALPAGEIVVGFAGDDGRFALSLDAGPAVVSASAPGYAPQQRHVELIQDQSVTLRLMPAARIAGTVRRAVAGQTTGPVAGAIVHAAPADDETRPRQTWADPAGRFEFTDLEPGRYVVWARTDRLAGFHDQPVSVALGEGVADVDVRLLAAAALTGRILDAHGAAVAGAVVELLPSGRTDLGFGSGRATALTNPAGRYLFAGILPGRYRLRAEGGGRSPSDLRDLGIFDQDVHEIDLRLGPSAIGVMPARDPAGRVAPAYLSGHVRWHDGAPAAGARVRWLPATRAGGDGGKTLVTVGVDGSYRLGPLPTGAGRCVAEYPSDPRVTSTWTSSWALPANALVFAGLGRGRQQRFGIDLKPGEQRGNVDLVLLRDDQSIAGIVRGPEGQPIAGALIWASQVPGGEWNPGESGRPRVVSDSGGRFVITGVPAGEYEVRALHPRFPLARKPGVVAGSESVAIDLVTPAWISGDVLDAGGAPLGPVRIAAIEALAPGGASHAPTSEAAGAHWLFQAGAGPAGSSGFTIGPLAPGEYHLLVRGAAGIGRLSGVTLAAGQWRRGLRIPLGTTPSARAEDLPRVR